MIVPQETPIAKAIQPYLDKGLTVRQISDASGASVRGIYNTIRWRGWGDRVRYKNRVKSRGRVDDVFLPEPIYQWIVKQCPDGLRVDEMVTAIVTDAYFEAQEEEEGALA